MLLADVPLPPHQDKDSLRRAKGKPEAALGGNWESLHIGKGVY